MQAVCRESPRWLAAHDLGQDLAQALAKLRFQDELDSEMEILRSEVQEKRDLGEASWQEIFSSRNMMRRRVMVRTA